MAPHALSRSIARRSQASIETVIERCSYHGVLQAESAIAPDVSLSDQQCPVRTTLTGH